jgi:cation transport ATPase
MQKEDAMKLLFAMAVAFGAVVLYRANAFKGRNRDKFTVDIVIFVVTTMALIALMGGC